MTECTIFPHCKLDNGHAGWCQRQSDSVDLPATYTAAEVKVLTEAALRLGRKEAGEEIAVRLEAVRDQIGDGAQRELCHDMAGIARYIASHASSAASDATSGVPGHQEVSEAVRSPQEPEECTCPPHIDGVGREKWPDCPVHTLKGDTP